MFSETKKIFSEHRQSIAFIAVRTTPDFDHVFHHGNDHFNDGKDLFSAGEDYLRSVDHILGGLDVGLCYRAIFSVVETMISASTTIFSSVKMMISVVETIFSGTEIIFSVPGTTSFATDKIFSVLEKSVGEAPAVLFHKQPAT